MTTDPDHAEHADRLERWAAADVGVGPWVGPWPVGEHWDPDLLANGDRRNVVDGFRYWRLEAIVAELDKNRHPLEVAVENWDHDFNIGSVIRTANAANAARVHIVGRRRWNRRGAMVTDRYLHVQHHGSAQSLAEHATTNALTIIGVDNVEGSVPLETFDLPRNCLMVFGSEGPGLSEEILERCTAVLAIGQFGSTRSINAGAAAGIAIHAWLRRHAFGQQPSPATPPGGIATPDSQPHFRL